MNSNRLYTLLFVLSLFLFGTAAKFGAEIPGLVVSIYRSALSDTAPKPLPRMALIDSAVTSVPKKKYFDYTGGFENPFRPVRSVHVVKTSKYKAAAPPRVKLSLKGILIKNKPLAILEDDMGQTYIRGVGEKALEQQVVAISDNRVTLRDHLGRYELTVEEQ